MASLAICVSVIVPSRFTACILAYSNSPSTACAFTNAIDALLIVPVISVAGTAVVQAPEVYLHNCPL